MTTPPPFDQPTPFEPRVAPPPLIRPQPAWRRRALPVVGALVLAVVAFAGGFGVANAISNKGTASAGNGNGNDGTGQFFGPGASGRPRNGGGAAFGGGASGTVGSVSSSQMTITTQSGSSRIVLLTPTTTVTEVTAATKTATDITNGETVTVIGTANPDGSVTATQVIIGDLGVLGRGGFGGRPGGANGSPSPSTAP
jgi:hypothetical protein